MESYDEWLSNQEVADMTRGKSIIMVMSKSELDIRRQVKYPDSVLVACRQGVINPARIKGAVSIYSLKQQAIVAKCHGLDQSHGC
ncbi:hypothetical protein F5Y16DRAFT_370965 [Xylariaceae sp. FL0255]|nr:hypothetical protein F5Y16DRAFT_370965 [Xylariaceae sp. FL0255]